MPNDDSELTQYKRFGEAGMALNILLVKQLRLGDVQKCGKDIALIRDSFMTTGAATPVSSHAAIDGVEQILERYAPARDSGGLSATQGASLEKQLVRMLLRTQSPDNIHY